MNPIYLTCGAAAILVYGVVGTWAYWRLRLCVRDLARGWIYLEGRIEALEGKGEESQ